MANNRVNGVNLEVLTRRLLVFRQEPQFRALLRNIGPDSARALVLKIYEDGTRAGAARDRVRLGGISAADRDWAIGIIDPPEAA